MIPELCKLTGNKKTINYLLLCSQLLDCEQSLFFLLSLLSCGKDIANTGTQKPRRGKTREEREKNRDYRQPIV